MIVCFEAMAMLHQFAKYMPPAVSLWPFGGDPSLEYKWRLAEHIDRAQGRYGKPITVLYFGDLDPKGVQIPRSALADVYAWAKTDFDSRRVALNPGQEIRFNIPENPSKPGEYQWEALTDEAARTLIEEALHGFYNPDKEESIREREQAATKAYQEALNGLEL